MKRSFKYTILRRPAVAGAILGLGLIGATRGRIASVQMPTPHFSFGGRGRQGPGVAGGRGLGVSLDTVAQRLGLSTDELKTQRHSGQSLAQLAQSKGINPQTLINQLVSDAASQLAQAVQSGQSARGPPPQRPITGVTSLRQRIRADATEGLYLMVSGM